MIQHLAASQAGRDIFYFPFNDIGLKRQIDSVIFNSNYVGGAYKEMIFYAESKVKEILRRKSVNMSQPSSFSTAKSFFSKN
jgi:hypothetical protein